MGSPLSAVMASLYMEVLENEHYRHIISGNSKWFRYVDDVLMITSYRTNTENLKDRLNQVNQNIQFTVEEEINGELPFLDTLIIRSGNGAKYRVYRKPTNKNDFIHFLSAHDDETKRGVVIGFFLRAMRICSEEFLSQEVDYIMGTFKELGYPSGLLFQLKQKAKNIIQRGPSEHKKNKYLVVPVSEVASELKKMLRDTGYNVVTSSGKRIGEIVKKTWTKDENSDNSVVYKIPCSGCDSSYFGETCRGLPTRLKEHKADVRHHRHTSALVAHIDEVGHLPKWDGAEVMRKGLTKKQRKVVESLYVTTKENINQRTGDMVWSSTAAKTIIAWEQRKEGWGTSGARRQVAEVGDHGQRQRLPHDQQSPLVLPT